MHKKREVDKVYGGKMGLSTSYKGIWCAGFPLNMVCSKK